MLPLVTKFPVSASGVFRLNVKAPADKLAADIFAPPVKVQLPFMVIAPFTVNGLLTVRVTAVRLPIVRLPQLKPVVLMLGLVPMKAFTPICAASPEPG